MRVSAIPVYAGHRFRAELVSQAIWLCFRFPQGLQHVDELLAVPGVTVSHEAGLRRDLRFGQGLGSHIRLRLPRAGDKWRLVDQDGFDG